VLFLLFCPAAVRQNSENMIVKIFSFISFLLIVSTLYFKERGKDTNIFPIVQEYKEKNERERFKPLSLE
jgi:hypothetical protein